MGQPGRKPTVSDGEILEIFTEASDPVLTTAEVTEEIDISQRGTFERLDSLAENGMLQMKKVGAQGAVWWLSEEK